MFTVRQLASMLTQEQIVDVYAERVQMDIDSNMEAKSRADDLQKQAELAAHNAQAASKQFSDTYTAAQKGIDIQKRLIEAAKKQTFIGHKSFGKPKGRRSNAKA